MDLGQEARGGWTWAPVLSETRRTCHTPHVAVGTGLVIVLCSHVGLHRLCCVLGICKEMSLGEKLNVLNITFFICLCSFQAC